MKDRKTHIFFDNNYIFMATFGSKIWVCHFQSPITFIFRSRFHNIFRKILSVWTEHCIPNSNSITYSGFGVYAVYLGVFPCNCCTRFSMQYNHQVCGIYAVDKQYNKERINYESFDENGVIQKPKRNLF